MSNLKDRLKKTIADKRDGKRKKAAKPKKSAKKKVAARKKKR